MKKALALLLCTVMFCSCACTTKETENTKATTEEIEEPSRTTEAPPETVDPDAAPDWITEMGYAINGPKEELFNNGLGGLMGVSYVPSAYLAYAEGNGTDHCFLAQASAFSPDAVPYWTLVFIHEEIGGRLSLSSVAVLGYDISLDSDRAVPGDNPKGDDPDAWQAGEANEMDGDAISIFDAGIRTLNSSDIRDPILCLGHKTTGTDTTYCFLVLRQTADRSVNPVWELVYIPVDADGYTGSLEIRTIDIAEFAEAE